MAGILNKRERFIDLIMTNEGKRQLFDGEMKPVYASLSDKFSVYDDDNDSQSNKKKIDKFNIEASSLSIDEIVLEVDDSGRLTLPSQSEEYSVVGNKIFEAIKEETRLTYNLVNSSSFASTAEKIKNQSIENFQKNKFLSSKSMLEKFDNFKIESNTHTFSITNSTPFPEGTLTQAIDIDDAEPFMFDSKLAHYKNFQFLPPVNKDGSNVGQYSDFRSTTKGDYQQIKNSLNISSFDFSPLDQEGTTVDYVGDVPIINRESNLNIDTVIAKPFKKIIFEDTSQHNNILLQIYEKNINGLKMKKLDIVDAGEFHDENDPQNPLKHVYYVGKVYFDTNNIPTFINMFTLIFD